MKLILCYILWRNGPSTKRGRLLSELMKNGTFYDVSLIHRLSVLNKNTSLLSITKYKAFSIVL